CSAWDSSPNTHLF
nr:immunoglobulin light chain junction region [Macaca mulatta]